MKAKHAYYNKYQAKEQKEAMDIPVVHRPGKASRARVGSGLNYIMQVILNKGGTKNKSIKAEVIERKMQKDIGFYAHGDCT